MEVEKIEEGLRKLAEKQGHSGLVTVESVAYKIDLREKLIAAYESENTDLVEKVREEREAFDRLNRGTATAQIDLVERLSFLESENNLLHGLVRARDNRLGALQKELTDRYEQIRDIISEFNGRCAEWREERSKHLVARTNLGDRVAKLKAALTRAEGDLFVRGVTLLQVVANIKAALNFDEQERQKAEEARKNRD